MVGKVDGRVVVEIVDGRVVAVFSTGRQSWQPLTESYR